jgi:hypothetical protein
MSAQADEVQAQAPGEATRDRIVQAARELVTENGYAIILSADDQRAERVRTGQAVARLINGLRKR